MDNQKRPSRTGYGVGAGVFLLGGFLFFMVATLGTRNMLRHEQAALEDFLRSPVPVEAQEVELVKGDLFALFIEHPTEEDAAEFVDVALFWDTGQEVDLFEPFDLRSRQHEGNHSVPYAEFVIEQSGTYRLSSALLTDSMDPPPVVALGPWPENDGSVLVIMVGWGGLILCLLGGLLIALRTFILRRRHPVAAG